MDKSQEIADYLERTKWAPVVFLLEKFDADRTDVSEAVEQLLNQVDVSVESDIIHVHV